MHNIDKVRKRRSFKLKFFSILMIIITTTTTIFWTYIYGISLWIVAPVIISSTVLSVFGTSYLLEKIYGLYAILKPVKGDIYHPFNYAKDLPEGTKIAVIMPVYHEDPARCTSAIEAMIEDVEKHSNKIHFDWFILSDSRKPDIIIQEEYSVFLLRSKFPNINIFYRQRINNTFAKVGNTSDFFRRWGGHYKYTVVLDADSMLPGKNMIDMARAMEGNERTALIQAINLGVNSKNLFGRWLTYEENFAKIFSSSGQFFYKMGKCHNFGHNIMLRTDAFIKYCALPNLPKTKLFPAGKPSSHDFYENDLLEGAGYHTWTLPLFISFEDQVNNFLDFIKREQRWIHGALDWFRLWNTPRLSTYGKKDILISVINYFNVPIGFIMFIASYFGVHYILTHPLKTFLIMNHAKNILLFGFVFFIASTLLPLFLSCLMLHKLKIFKNVGGIINFIFSYIVCFIINIFTAPITMVSVNLILFGWSRGKRIVWDAQNRQGRTLSWSECWNNLKYVSLFGWIMALYMCFYILPYMTHKTFTLLHLSPYLLSFFIFPPIIGLAFSPVIVRFMSKEFPLMQKMGWLQHQFERPEDEYFVVKRTRELTSIYAEKLDKMTFENAFKDPFYALHHIANTPSRPNKFKFWENKLKNKDISECTRLEKLVIWRCRELYDMFFVKELHK